MTGNDRARTERQDEGFLKVVSDRRGRVRGVTIVGLKAGELLAPWCLAMASRLTLSALARDIPMRAEPSDGIRDRAAAVRGLFHQLGSCCALCHSP